MRCSRCGREPRPDELTSIGALVNDPSAGVEQESPFGASAPWAAIGDEVVCPTCQSDEETEETARRIIEAVEAEIQRSRGEGADPTEHESALIAYAMFLRERVGLTPPPPG